MGIGTANLHVIQVLLYNRDQENKSCGYWKIMILEDHKNWYSISCMPDVMPNS